MRGTTWRTPRRAVIALCAVASCTALAAGAAAQESIALLNVQEAVASTGEGQKLIAELEQKYRPTQQRLESLQQEVNRKRDQYQKGANTMSDEARRNLAREIQRAEVDLQRETEDARGEFSQEQGQLFSSVGQKMMTIIDRYANERGFRIVLDISNPNSPVLFAVNDVNITTAIIAAYDAAHPVEGASPAE